MIGVRRRPGATRLATRRAAWLADRLAPPRLGDELLELRVERVVAQVVQCFHHRLLTFGQIRDHRVAEEVACVQQKGVFRLLPRPSDGPGQPTEAPPLPDRIILEVALPALPGGQVAVDVVGVKDHDGRYGYPFQVRSVSDAFF